MIQPTLFSVVTHIDHLFHPLDEKMGLNENSTLHKVAGVALFIFLGVLTLGVAFIFYSVMAQRKVTAYQASLEEVPVDENQNFEYVLEKVKTASKAALFIGRTDDQPVPQGDGFNWFTLDID